MRLFLEIENENVNILHTGSFFMLKYVDFEHVENSTSDNLRCIWSFVKTIIVKNFPFITKCQIYAVFILITTYRISRCDLENRIFPHAQKTVLHLGHQSYKRFLFSCFNLFQLVFFFGFKWKKNSFTIQIENDSIDKKNQNSKSK